MTKKDLIEYLKEFEDTTEICYHDENSKNLLAFNASYHIPLVPVTTPSRVITSNDKTIAVLI